MLLVVGVIGCEGTISLDGVEAGARPDAGQRVGADAGPRPSGDAGAGSRADAGAGSSGSDAGSGGDGLGVCSGTAAECEAARVINAYRASHAQPGECNHPLRWDANLGRLAHEHQSGAFVRHSSHGYVENVGQAYGVRETAEYIVQWEAGSEEHCRADGSYTVSHHCAAMFCNNFTVGVGVFEGGGGGATYMTMIFGDEDGQPSW